MVGAGRRAVVSDDDDDDDDEQREEEEQQKEEVEEEVEVEDDEGAGVLCDRIECFWGSQAHLIPGLLRTEGSYFRPIGPAMPAPSGAAWA